MMAANMIRLAVVDVDGCLTPGEAGDWNWEALQTLCDFNRRARQGERVPAVTLCTGRQEPYVEVLMQAIGAYLPGIYENGCGLYLPDAYRFIEHPSITASVREAMTAARATLQRQVVAPGLGYFQPGKEASLTIYPLPGTGVRGLYQAVMDALGCLPSASPANDGPHPGVSRLAVQASISCVDVTPEGIDKGAGVRWLSEEIGLPLAHMGGIGDSASDLKFMRLLGRSAAPANAASEVKVAVDYVSPYQNGDGVVDILHHWCDQPSQGF